MENQLDLRLSRLENTVRQQGRALEMLGIVMCTFCGKPHHGRALHQVPGSSFLYLRRKETDASEAPGALLPVCMDDPVAARCFLAMINKTEVDATGKAVRVEYANPARSLAMWVLESRSYLSTAPYSGFVQSVMAGESMIESQEFAFELAYWRPAGFGGVLAGESVRDLMRICGWNMDDAEHASLIARCRSYAIAHVHATQVKHFSAPAHAWPRTILTEKIR